MNKYNQFVNTLALVGAFLLLAPFGYGGVPLNNLEGVGGVAFNPLAYPAGQNKDSVAESNSWQDVFSKPQFGAWYTYLGDVNVDWTAIGVAETLFNRLEVSYGYELIAPNGKNIRKSNVGAKLLLIPENIGGQNYIPAVSVGSIWKYTTPVVTDIAGNAFDFYAVATKLITQLPLPVLLSAGVLLTKGRTTGVFGYDDERATTFFGNIDVIPLSSVAVGLEYKQGARFSDFNNADYRDAHLAWFASKNLTLVGAYVNAGSEDSTASVGLGNGLVLSAQYAF